MTKKDAKFQLPNHLINQLVECSNGFFLVVLNQDQEFEVFQNLPTPLVQLGIANFLDIFSSGWSKGMRDPENGIIGPLRDEEGDEGEDDEEDDEEEEEA